MVNFVRRHILLICVLVGSVWLNSCNGWDDDSEFIAGTKASFFLVEPTAGGPNSLIRMEGDAIIPDWNTEFAIGNLAFTDFDAELDQMWLTDISQREIVQIDLGNNQIERSYSTDELQPHFMAAGASFFLIADSSRNELAFIHRKKKDFQRIPLAQRPGRILYNAQKFYLQLDSSKVAIYSEIAFTPIATFDLGAKIVDFQFLRNKQVEILTESNGDYAISTIESNGDFLVRENVSVNFQKRRYTPYFSQRFESEYLNNIELKEDGTLASPGLISIDADNFEVDFFESTLFYSFNDTLNIYQLDTDATISRLPFPWRLNRSWHWLSSGG